MTDPLLSAEPPYGRHSGQSLLHTFGHKGACQRADAGKYRASLSTGVRTSCQQPTWVLEALPFPWSDLHALLMTCQGRA